MRYRPEYPIAGLMKGSVLIGIFFFLFSSLYGCEPKTRYHVLSIFFDGVPNPEEEALQQRRGKEGTDGAKLAKTTYKQHGPYEARMCDACHSRSTNALMLPVEKLCLKCHAIQMNKKYVHGPVAAGGCKICHDPHGSSFPYLLVSEPATFCFYCHNEKDVAKNEAHKGVSEGCTACHDAHMSDNAYLLK